MRELKSATAYRLEGKCGDLATIDLNSLLFKYETDIANAIFEIFDDHLVLEEDFELSAFPFGTAQPYEVPTSLHVETYGPGISSRSKVQTSSEWFARAGRRQQLINRGSIACSRTSCQANLHRLPLGRRARHVLRPGHVDLHPPLLRDGHVLLAHVGRYCLRGAVVADDARRTAQVRGRWRQVSRHWVSILLMAGAGLVAGTEASRGRVGLDRPSRQWVRFPSYRRWFA
jgi:hypothetical protein